MLLNNMRHNVVTDAKLRFRRVCRQYFLLLKYNRMIMFRNERQRDNASGRLPQYVYSHAQTQRNSSVRTAAASQKERDPAGCSTRQASFQTQLIFLLFLFFLLEDLLFLLDVLLQSQFLHFLLHLHLGKSRFCGGLFIPCPSKP